MPSPELAPLQLPLPQLVVDAAGVAQSLRFGDVYASRAGAVAQAHDVYLAGVDLPARWQQQKLHTVLELGFGLGGNFLATLNAWRNDPGAATQLDYVAIEGYPIAAADFAKLNPNRHPMIAELASRWPDAEPGFHCIEFENGRVRLILVFWDVLKALVELNIHADSVYLDGFSPAKNPEMWSKPVLTGVRRLLKPGARLASYSVAGALRAHLTELGFSVARKPGFAEKKQRLEAVLPIAPHVMQLERPSSIAIIGAGIVGLALADKLCHAGFEVTLIERGNAPGAGASGVPAALVHPPSGAADSFEFGIQSHAHRYAKQRIAALNAAGFDAGFAPLTIFEQRKNGRTLTHLAGGWLRPSCLLTALVTDALSTGKLTLLRNTCVQSLRPDGLGATLNFDGKSQHFDAVIVCNGIAAAELLPTLALRPVTGQVELVRSDCLAERGLHGGQTALHADRVVPRRGQCGAQHGDLLGLLLQVGVGGLDGLQRVVQQLALGVGHLHGLQRRSELGRLGLDGAVGLLGRLRHLGQLLPRQLLQLLLQVAHLAAKGLLGHGGSVGGLSSLRCRLLGLLRALLRLGSGAGQRLLECRQLRGVRAQRVADGVRGAELRGHRRLRGGRCGEQRGL